MTLYTKALYKVQLKITKTKMKNLESLMALNNNSSIFFEDKFIGRRKGPEGGPKQRSSSETNPKLKNLEKKEKNEKLKTVAKSLTEKHIKTVLKAHLETALKKGNLKKLNGKIKPPTKEWVRLTLFADEYTEKVIKKGYTTKPKHDLDFDHIEKTVPAVVDKNILVKGNLEVDLKKMHSEMTKALKHPGMKKRVEKLKKEIIKDEVTSGTYKGSDKIADKFDKKRIAQTIIGPAINGLHAGQYENDLSNTRTTIGQKRKVSEAIFKAAQEKLCRMGVLTDVDLDNSNDPIINTRLYDGNKFNRYKNKFRNTKTLKKYLSNYINKDKDVIAAKNAPDNNYKNEPTRIARR